MFCEPCNKRLYGSRKAAHNAMATASNSVRLYFCDHHPGYYHVTSERSSGLNRRG